ncbi:MAG: hypothetical protein MJ216_00865 [Bacilli bacterium]|nr:hypothetical protein [Bacilli bacterium]
MKKLINGRLPLLIVIIAFAIFNVIFWPITATHIDEVKAGQWVGYIFISVAFVITGAITFIPLKSKNNFVSTLPMFFSVCGYFAIAFIINLIAVFIPSKEVVWIIVLNSVLILLFAAALLISYRTLSRTEDNTARREARVKQFRLYAAEINSIKDAAQDEEVKRKLASLQDNVNYSSPATNASTIEKEVEFSEKIQQINDMVNSGVEKEEILKAINDAERILKTRNQILMATK